MRSRGVLINSSLWRQSHLYLVPSRCEAFYEHPPKASTPIPLKSTFPMTHQSKSQSLSQHRSPSLLSLPSSLPPLLVPSLQSYIDSDVRIHRVLLEHFPAILDPLRELRPTPLQPVLLLSFLYVFRLLLSTASFVVVVAWLFGSWLRFWSCIGDCG